MGLGSDGLVYDLKSLVLRGQNCDDWLTNLNSLMFVDMGTPEGLDGNYPFYVTTESG